MSKRFFPLLLMVLFVVLSCSDPSNKEDNKEDDNKEKPANAVYSKEYWGEWLRMDMDETWYISNNAISVNGTSFTGSVSMTKQSDRVIEVSDSGRKYYLFASRTATTSFSGKIAEASPTYSNARSSGIGGVDVKVSNRKNKGNEMTVTTTADGAYTVKEAIPGDEYVINVGGKTAVVSPYNDGDEVGILTITEGVNFKSRLIPKIGDLDMTRLYADYTNYEFTLEISNVGTEDCTAAIYSLEFDQDLIVQSTVSTYDRLGTIEPGRNKLINIGVACKTIYSAWEDKKVKILITDPIVGKTWEDFVNIRFNKSPVHFVIMSEREVNGVIISPNATATQFSTMWDGTNYGTIASLPWSDKDYLVVFSGATADTEAVYSMGVNTIPDTNFRTFMDLARYEPNNMENQATPIMTQDRIISYLHKNDIDYYKINLSQSPAGKPLSLIGTLCRVLQSENNEGGIYMDVLLKNNGTTGTGGTAVLRSNNEDAIMEQDTVSITNVGGGKYRTLQSADGATPAEAAYYAGSGLENLFKFKSMASGGIFSFTITFTLDSGESWEEQFITAPGDSSSVFAGVSGANVAEKLKFIARQTKNNVEYVVTVRNDETLSPQTVTSLGNNVTVTLRSVSVNNIKTISLSGNGSLLTVSNGITLKLENIILRGHNNNNAALVMVSKDGSLAIEDGTEIVGNNNHYNKLPWSKGGEKEPLTANGGGICIIEGHFIMNGGEIYDNKTDLNGAGIILINSTGVINDGKIYNNEAVYDGGGINVSSSGFTMRGGIIYGNRAGWGGGIRIAINDSRYYFRKEPATGSNTSGVIYGSDAANNLANKASTYGDAIAQYGTFAAKRNKTLNETTNISTDNRNIGWE